MVKRTVVRRKERQRYKTRVKIMNIWDWELLGDNGEDRLQNWVDQTWLKNYINYGVNLTSEEIRDKHLQLQKNLLFAAIARLQEFWLHAHHVTKYRLFNWRTQDLNEDKRHWLHGRGWLKILLNNQYWVENWNGPTLYVSWCLPTSHSHLEIQVGGEDEGIGFSFACKFFAVWVELQEVLPQKWARKISKYGHERVSGISFHDGYIWLDLWRDEYGYSNWQGLHLSFNVPDFIFGKTKYSDRELTRQTRTVSFEEGDYEVEVVIKERTWKRPRKLFPLITVDADITPTTPIPIPGKGENSWDCDEDAVYALSTSEAKTVDDAIAYFKESVLRDRRRYGGEKWVPGAIA